MADTITIPSPSVFLTTSPVQSHESPPKPAASNKPKQQRKRNPTATRAKAFVEKPGEQNGNNGVEKKKQSKSRNGMYLPFLNFYHTRACILTPLIKVILVAN
jgi:hypothetical protein